MNFLNNKYRCWYDRLMERARGRVLVEAGERHHVLPRALGGADGEVLALSYREHFLAHWLLTKFTDGKARMSMQYALGRMGDLSPGRRKAGVRIASWQYALARKANAEGRRARETKPETREKMRAAMLGRTITPEWREKLRTSRLGKPLSEETKALLRAASLGKSQSDEARKKNRLAHLGRAKSAETRQRMSNSKRGHATSEETKQKIRAGNLGKKLSEETKAKMSVARTGLTHSEETKSKIRAAHKRRFAPAQEEVSQWTD